jgi:predicted SnoaL-like aldol condensation-catalyzing enzyme
MPTSSEVNGVAFWWMLDLQDQRRKFKERLSREARRHITSLVKIATKSNQCGNFSIHQNRQKKREPMKTTPQQNKKLVIEAFDTLFNKRDYAAAEKFWSPNYIQHSAHIAPGRDGLFNLIKASLHSLKYEHELIMAEGDFVIVHGRYSNTGLPLNWIVADIVRIENGVLAEHWDVIQNEASKTESKSGLPMFGHDFPN